MIYLDQLHPDADIVNPIWNDPATPAAFRTFWNAERPKIGARLVWREKLRSEDPPACAYFDADDIFVIFLDRIPPTPADAVMIAHELTHAVMQHCEGYSAPSDVRQNHFNAGATMLGSMLQDPLITRRLRAYGFDVPQPLHILDEPRPQPAGLLNQIINAWWFELFQLCHIEAKDRPLPAGVVARFRQRYPAVWQHVEHVESAIKRAGGYETPAQHVAIYHRLIERYKLSSEIALL